VRGNGAKTEDVELIEQQLDIRRDVVGDENQLGVGRIRCSTSMRAH